MASTGGQDESILMSNNLPVATLKRNISSVCQLVFAQGNVLRKSSGFLAKFSIDDNQVVVVVMNNHFVSRKEEARHIQATFEYEGRNEVKTVILNPEIFFKTDEPHDYTFVGISQQDIEDLRLIYDVTPVKLQETKFCVDVNDVIVIPQHPHGKPKRISYSTVSHMTQHEVFYRADTSEGSSGSPVLFVQNNDMFVLALHKSGSATLKDGRLANRGILMNRILAHIRKHRGNDERPPNSDDGASSSGTYESGAHVQDPTTSQNEKNSDSTSSINNIARRDPSCVQESGMPLPKTPSTKVSEKPPSSASPEGPQPCCQRRICTEPFETKELIRIAQRMGEKWPIVAKQTGMFKEWEISNILCNITLTNNTLKADRMLTDFKARLGTREVIAEAIENSKDLELAEKVRSGFYIWNID